MHRWRWWGGVLAGLAMVFAAGTATAGETVKVGAYYFPPYVEQTADGLGGMVVDLVVAMNAAQDDFTFELVETTARGRYDDLAAGKFDMIAFESLDWGWQDRDVIASDVFMTGAEIYVARADPGRDQSYFDDLTGHKIAAIYGFHYGFAGFNADPAYLETAFIVELSLNPASSLYYVQDGHADIAVVPRAYLHKFLMAHPELEGRFLVADEVDQEYRHSFVMRPDSPADVEAINTLMAELEQSGALDRIREGDVP